MRVSSGIKGAQWVRDHIEGDISMGLV